MANVMWEFFSSQASFNLESIFMTTKDKSDNDSAEYLQLKAASAKKIGKLSVGSIHYQILSDKAKVNLFIRVTGNDGGGYFSQELVSMQEIERCLKSRSNTDPFPSKVLMDVFVGRSANNAGFLAAILRAEGILSAAPDTETQHIFLGDMAKFKKACLAEPGTAIVISSGKPEKSIPAQIAAPETEHTEDRKTLKITKKPA